MSLIFPKIFFKSDHLNSSACCFDLSLCRLRNLSSLYGDFLGDFAAAENLETIIYLFDNACINKCGELEAKNEEIEKEKLEGEAEEFVSANADVIPEEMTEEIKNEYVEDKEKAEVTVANFRKVHDRAVLNAAKAATVQKQPVKKAINWREAKKPVVNFQQMLAEADGDPAKENEIIKNMCAKH